MSFQSKLKLSDVLSCSAFIVQSKQLFSDNERINVRKLDWEQHLAVALKFLKHVRVAIFKNVEELFDLFKYKLFGGAGVYPLCQMVKDFLLKLLAVLLASKVGVNGAHTLAVGGCESLFGGTAIQVQNKQACHVSHLSGQSDHKCVLQV